MTFTTPLGLLALVGVPVVVFLHLFRRRFRVRRVAGLFLFAPDALVASSGRTRTRLLKTPSFWLEILAALLGALWLGGPTIGAAERVPHLVVVLDDSASMGAKGVGERVRAALNEVIEELPSNAVGTLITTGTRPEVIAGPRVPIALLAPALAEQSPRRPHHDPGPALLLGREIAGDEGQLLLLTDRPLDTAPAEYEVRAVGTASPNAAVIGARRADGKVYFDLLAFGERAFSTAFTLRIGDQQAKRETVDLKPGRPLHLSFQDTQPRASLTLTLESDALAIDNEITLLPEPLRIVPIASTLPKQTADLLLLDEALAALPGVRRVERAQAARLHFAAKAPQLAHGASSVEVRTTGSETDAWIGPYLIERRHPILRGLTLEGVVWTAGRDAPTGAPLILAGEQTLVAESFVEGGGLRLHLNLDPARSNLASSPDWPILLANVVEYVRRRLPGQQVANVRLGDVLSYRGDVLSYRGGEAPDLTLVDPAGGRRGARGRMVFTWIARRPGVHRLLGKNGKELARWSVHFVDPHESDLTGAATSVREAGGAAAQGTSREGHRERTVLALLLLIAVAADWWVLGKGAA